MSEHSETFINIYPKFPKSFAKLLISIVWICKIHDFSPYMLYGNDSSGIATFTTMMLSIDLNLNGDDRSISSCHFVVALFGWVWL